MQGVLSFNREKEQRRHDDLLLITKKWQSEPETKVFELMHGNLCTIAVFATRAMAVITLVSLAHCYRKADQLST
jgi:hypothetical protein